MSKTEDQESVLTWRKSKYSVVNGACAEVAAIPGIVMVRDSLGRPDVQLRFAPAAWQEFTDRLKGA
jgi:Domain of unknown function (DUF397)